MIESELTFCGATRQSKKRALTVPAMKPPGPRKYQRLYYHFGPPIPTAAFQRNDCEANSTHLRDQTQEVILSGLRFLQAVQRVDPNRFGYVRFVLAPQSQ